MISRSTASTLPPGGFHLVLFPHSGSPLIHHYFFSRCLLLSSVHLDSSGVVVYLFRRYRQCCWIKGNRWFRVVKVRFFRVIREEFHKDTDHWLLIYVRPSEELRICTFVEQAQSFG